MESLNQEPYAGRLLKEWVTNIGLEHIVTEETNVNCGNIYSSQIRIARVLIQRLYYRTRYRKSKNFEMVLE